MGVLFDFGTNHYIIMKVTLVVALAAVTSCVVAEPEAGADANQGYGSPVYTPYGHSGHGYGQVSAYGHPLYKREAEAAAEADPALLYGGYYGYGLGYYGGYRGYYGHPYAVAAGLPYANGWTDGPNNGVGHYGYHYLGKREAEAEPEAEEVEAAEAAAPVAVYPHSGGPYNYGWTDGPNNGVGVAYGVPLTYGYGFGHPFIFYG